MKSTSLRNISQKFQHLFAGFDRVRFEDGYSFRVQKHILQKSGNVFHFHKSDGDVKAVRIVTLAETVLKQQPGGIMR
ncbi:MAG: hypothetical protein AMXMBFR84_48660 [Candidatus Hydrogenedentota bacterium]